MRPVIISWELELARTMAELWSNLTSHSAIAGALGASESATAMRFRRGRSFRAFSTIAGGPLRDVELSIRLSDSSGLVRAVCDLTCTPRSTIGWLQARFGVGPQIRKAVTQLMASAAAADPAAESMDEVAPGREVTLAQEVAVGHYTLQIGGESCPIQVTQLADSAAGSVTLTRGGPQPERLQVLPGAMAIKVKNRRSDSQLIVLSRLPEAERRRAAAS